MAITSPDNCLSDSKPTLPLTPSVELSSPKRRCSTYGDRLDIIDYCHANPHLMQTEVAFHFRAQFPSLSQPTISRYLAREGAIRRYVAQHLERLTFTRPIYVSLAFIETALEGWVHRTFEDASTLLTRGGIFQKGRRFDQCQVVPGAKCESLYCPTRGRLTCLTQQREAGFCRYRLYQTRNYPVKDFSNLPMFGLLLDKSHPASHTYRRPINSPTPEASEHSRSPLGSDHQLEGAD
ncbi:hypothetical protein FRC12_023394 [Ceratobasidium sp. 428]|nr:hypothetical protein FRC12_023394 [Ceratobasidium sp. 428]